MILGAGILQTYVIKKAKQLGIYTIAVDVNPHSIGFQYADKSYTIDITDQVSCLDCAKKEGISGILSPATDYGVLTASHISDNLGLPGIPYEVVNIIKSKYITRVKTIHLYNSEYLQFFEISSIEQVLSLNGKLRFPVMIKPVDGSGSKGTGRADDFHTFIKLCENALKISLSKKVLVESYINGEEYGVESFVYKGTVYVLVIMKKYMTKPPYYAELGHSVPADLPQKTEQRVLSIVKDTINALNITFGSVNMDLIITKEGVPYIIDIGARMGGNLIGSHIVPIATGIDYIGNIIKASIGEHIDFKSCTGQPVSTALLALSPGIIKQLPDLSTYRKRNNVIDVVFIKNIGDKINLYTNNLDGCGYIVTTGQDSSKAHDLAFSIRDEIDKLIIRG